jgi:hypothetical protein
VRRAGGAKESGQRPRKGEQSDGVEHKEGAVGRGRREGRDRANRKNVARMDVRMGGE